MGYKFINIDTDKLIVNKENPRFSSVKNEYEAIKTIILKQQEKLLNLIEDIAGNGLNPSELIIVVEEEGKYVVLEGNRRVTAIKLINDLDFYADIDSKFANKASVILSRKSAHSINEINTIVFDDRLEANRWIKIKHTGENLGIGILGWSKERKESFISENGKMDKVYKVLEYVKQSKYYSDDLKIRLNDIKLSHLSRLLDDPHVRETIGLTLKNKKLYRLVSEEELSKGLSKILYDILNGIFKGKSISTKENRLAYIEGFTEKQLPCYEKEVIEIATLAATGLNDRNEILYNNEQMTLNDVNVIDEITMEVLEEDNKSLLPKIKIKSKDIVLATTKNNRNRRKYLIPSDFNVKIEDKALGAIYKELKTLDIKRYSNSVEILFRVFIEKIVLTYIKKNNFAIEKNENLNLIETIQYIIIDLKNKGKITLEDEVFVEELLKEKNGIFKSETLKDYTMNKERFIDIISLKESWDMLEVFLKILILNIN